MVLKAAMEPSVEALAGSAFHSLIADRQMSGGVSWSSSKGHVVFGCVLCCPLVQNVVIEHFLACSYPHPLVDR